MMKKKIKYRRDKENRNKRKEREYKEGKADDKRIE